VRSCVAHVRTRRHRRCALCSVSRRTRPRAGQTGSSSAPALGRRSRPGDFAARSCHHGDDSHARLPAALARRYRGRSIGCRCRFPSRTRSNEKLACGGAVDSYAAHAQPAASSPVPGRMRGPRPSRHRRTGGSIHHPDGARSSWMGDRMHAPIADEGVLARRPVALGGRLHGHRNRHSTRSTRAEYVAAARVRAKGVVARNALFRAHNRDSALCDRHRPKRMALP
jgi:hypothetical protein